MTGETEADVSELLKSLDVAVDNAISDKDLATLDSIVAKDFVYTHSIERVDPYPAFMKWVGGRTANSRRALSDVETEMHGDVAVTRGNLDIVYEDQSRKLLRYVRVYRLFDDGWRLISSRTANATDRAG